MKKRIRNTIKSQLKNCSMSKQLYSKQMELAT